MSERHFRVDHGFVCRYTPTILDGPVFRWGGRFEVSASRNGVMLQVDGPLMGEQGVENFIKLLNLAASVHRQLQKDDRPSELWFDEDRVLENVWVSKAL